MKYVRLTTVAAVMGVSAGLWAIGSHEASDAE
jgi:hypothetical protein